MCRADNSSMISISSCDLYHFLHILKTAPHVISEPRPFLLLDSFAQLSLFSLVSLLFLVFLTKVDPNISSPPFLYVLLIILSYHKSLCSLWMQEGFPFPSPPQKCFPGVFSVSSFFFFPPCPYSWPNHGKYLKETSAPQ